MREAIALFAKAAVPGRVKTRLTSALTPEQAAAFHEACVRDVWEKIRGLVGEGAFLYSDAEWEPWDLLAGAQVRFQRDGDLGDRMLGCFEELVEEGFERVLIVGSDSPTLPAAILRDGLDALEGDEDTVLGPTEDGGYYTVGCRRPHERMFGEVAWSADTTFEQTQSAFRRVGYQTTVLPEWWDVDTSEDLERLRAAGPEGRVGEWLAG